MARILPKLIGSLALWLVMAPGLAEPSARATGMERLVEAVHGSLQDRGLLLEDPALLAPVNELLQELSPDFPVRPYLLRLAEPHAFGMPGGRVYLNLGLFPVLQTREELAFVLLHELSHLRQDHARQRGELRRSGSGFQLALEREADRLALEALQRRGWPLPDSKALLDAVEAQFARLAMNDPAMIEALAARREQLPASFGNSGAAWPAMNRLRSEGLELLLEQGRMLAVEPWLRPGCDGLLGWRPCRRLRADLLRLRGGAENLEVAVAAYRSVLASGDDRAARAGLALTLDALGRCTAALEPWRELLAGAPPERDLIERRLAIEGCPRQAPGPVLTGLPQAAPGWRELERSRDQAVYTRDGRRLQTLRVYLGPAEALPPLNALDRAGRDLARRFDDRRVRLGRARGFDGGGWVADFEHVDEQGLAWCTRLYRLAAPGEVLAAEFTAPCRHYFERDLGDVDRWIQGWFGT